MTETTRSRGARPAIPFLRASSTLERLDPSPPDRDAGDAGTSSGGGRVVTVGLVAAVIVTFVLAEWHVAPFRSAMGSLAPRMSSLLYAVAAVALLASILRRFRSSRAGKEIPLDLHPPVGRFRHLAVPAAISGSILPYLVTLFGAWASSFRPPLNLAGVVPYSDSTLWFGGAVRLLFNGFVDDYNGKRPLNPALFAVRLALTNFDMRLAMVLQAVLLGVACWLLCRVVARQLGVPAALALFAGIFTFVGPFSATAHTEALGVTFGALAAALLWSALHDRNSRLFAAGLFVLTAGLGVRPGAIFVAFLLPLWFARTARQDKDRLVVWPALRLGVGAVVAGLAVTLAASFSTGGNPANLNSNSLYMVYGLAMGYPGWDIAHQGWGRVFDDHPELLPLDDSARTVAIRRFASQAVRDHPYRFARSLLLSERNYMRLAKGHTMFIPHLLLRRTAQVAALLLGVLALHRRRSEGRRSLLVDLGLFCASLLCLPVLLVWSTLTGVPGWLGGALTIVFYCAFVLVGSRRVLASAHSGFLLVATAGLVVSIPLIGLDSARVLAVTAPLMALHLAVAVSILAGGPDNLPSGEVSPSPAVPPNRWSPAVAGTGLIAVGLLGAPLAAAVIDKPHVDRRICPDGRPAQAILAPSSVRIVEDEAHVDGVDAMDAQAAARDMEMIPGLGTVKPLVRPGTTIVAGVNERGGDRIVFLTGLVRTSGSSVVYFCGSDLGDTISAVFTVGFWPKPVDFAFMTGTPLAP